jgi:hypothetical protein
MVSIAMEPAFFATILKDHEEEVFRKSNVAGDETSCSAG